MIDVDYTESLLAARKAGQTVVASIYTYDELAFLMDAPLEDTVDFPSMLNSEAVLRSTGLRVDFSTQGPASSNIVKAGASEGQEHNTYTVDLSGVLTKRHIDSTYDEATIPKVTPQDANYAVKSLNYPAKKPRGTAIDGLRLDDKANPIDSTMVAQLTVAQIFNHWGIDTADLVTYINKHWNIDYTQKIITNASLARAADLELYLASGGRPAPSLYFSSNIVSRMHMESMPRIEFDKVGYTQVFVGRSRALATYHAVTLEMVYGRGCIDRISYHMNPAQLSKFTPVSIVDNKFVLPNRIPRAPGRNSIAGITSYQDYVDARLSVKAAEATTRADVLNTVMLISAKSWQPIKSDLRSSRVTTNIFGHKDAATGPARESNEMASPSKVSTILFGLYHGNTDSKYFLTVKATAAAVGALCAVDTNIGAISYMWEHITQGRGLGETLRGVNLERAREYKEINAIAGRASNSAYARIAYLYLVKRHVNHIRDNVVLAIETISRGLRSAGSHIPIYTPKGIINIGMAGGMARTYKAIEKYLQTAIETRPFVYVKRYTKLAIHAGAQSSLLYYDPKSILTYITHDPADGDDNRIRPLISTIRKYWVTYYHDTAMCYQRIVRALNAVPDVGAIKLSNAPVKSSSPKELVPFCISGLVAEYVYYQSMSLAYKWYSVDFAKGIIVANDNTDRSSRWKDTISTYKKALMSGTGEVIVVSSHADKLYRNSYARADLEKRVSQIVDVIITTDKTALTNQVTKALRTAYGEAYDRVKGTYDEAVATDRKAVKVDVAPAKVDTAPTVKAPIADIGKAFMDILKSKITHVEKPTHSRNRQFLLNAVYDIATVDVPFSDTFEELVLDMSETAITDNYKDLEALAKLGMAYGDSPDFYDKDITYDKMTAIYQKITGKAVVKSSSIMS